MFESFVTTTYTGLNASHSTGQGVVEAMPSDKVLDRWKTAPVLLTGASGVIGVALAEELRRSGYDTVITTSSRDADLTDQREAARLLRSVRPSLVFHLAARVYGIMGNIKNKGQAYFDNVRINTNVVEAAREAGVEKIVAMGSTAIYSDIVPLPMSEKDIWLGPPHPSEAAYAHAKRGMLAHLEAYHSQYGLDFAFCISTNLFGPGDKFDEQFGHVIPSLISKFHRAVTEGSAVEVWGTGSPQRDFLYAKDAARAMRLVAEQYTGPINLATGIPVSIREAVETLREISRYRGEVLWDRSKPDGQKLRDYNIDTLRNLGFEPQYRFSEAMQETYDWYADAAGQVRR